MAQYSDQLRGSTQTQFAGLHHSPAAGDGELYDMHNMTGDFAPLLATRQKRRKVGQLTAPGGIVSWGKLAWVDGTDFVYDAQVVGHVTAGRKSIVAMGAYLLIFPDKAYYDTLAGEFGSLEASWSSGGAAVVQFMDGTIYGVEAKANCLYSPGVGWASMFSPGDAVTIAGCTLHPENNKTAIVREIDGDKLMFSEYAFALDGDAAYTESGTITVSRDVPDLRFVCVNENRLWGSDGNTIYASKLGDPFNFNVFDGLDSDAWAWPADEAGIIGGITACVSFLGYPIFFQEDKIYKVYGSTPTNYETMGSAALGVMAGAERSLAIAGETLYYLSSAGVMAYGGGLPRPIGQAFGLERHRDAVGGSDGLKYYVSLKDGAGKWTLCVYDPQQGTWHKEDGTEAVGFARNGGNTYVLGKDGGLWVTGTVLGTPGTAEADFNWWAEFADYTDGSPDKKGVEQLQIRLELEAGASCKAELRFDSTGDWLQAGAVMAEGTKRSYVLPIIPRRADHYRLKLSGTGGCRVYSITRTIYPGSKLRSQTGPN